MWGVCSQIRRPNNYDINVSLMLGPTEPDPTMDVSSLDIVKTVVQDSPHKLFIGGLPCDWSEDQVSATSVTPPADHVHRGSLPWMPNAKWLPDLALPGCCMKWLRISLRYPACLCDMHAFVTYMMLCGWVIFYSAGVIPVGAGQM